jgi:hypothetical protein
VRSLLATSGAMILPTWTEDRATLGSDPSADPGAHTEDRGVSVAPRSLIPLRDEHQCVKPTWPLTRLRLFQPAPSRSRRTSTSAGRDEEEIGTDYRKTDVTVTRGPLGLSLFGVQKGCPEPTW